VPDQDAWLWLFELPPIGLLGPVVVAAERHVSIRMTLVRESTDDIIMGLTEREAGAALVVLARAHPAVGCDGASQVEARHRERGQRSSDWSQL